MGHEALLGTNTVEASSTTGTITVGSAVSAGRVVVVSVVWSGDGSAIPTGISAADTRGNSYALDASAGTGNGTASCAILRGTITTGLQVSDVITVTTTSARVRWMLQADEVSGLSASPLDQTAANHAPASSATMLTGTTATTTQASEYLHAVWGFGRGSAQTVSSVGGWSSTAQVNTVSGATPRGMQAAYTAVSATGTQQGSATLSASAAHVGCIATYKVTSPALGRVTGTGTARALTASRTYSVGRVTGTGTAQPLTAALSYPLGRVTSTGTAQALTAAMSGNVTSMPDIWVEIAFSTGADTGTLLQLDDPTRGLLDTGTLAGTEVDEPVWVDVTEWMLSGAINRGAQRVDTPLVQYEAGTLTVVLDNSDRRFDPSNLGGPYVDASNGVTQVTAMRAIRVRAQWDGTYYGLFRGFIDAWDIDWVGSYSEATVSATDAFKVLTGIDRPAIAEIGASETTGARIGRILDSADWPDADRVIATGESTVQATTLEGVALEELQLTTASELGELYVDGAGKVVFRGRHDLLQDDRSAMSQGTFGEDTGDLPYIDLEISTDDATFYNDVRVTRAGGTEQQVTDATSQALYYRRTYKADTEPIVESDTEALAYAQWLLHVAADPELRFVSMTLNPRGAEPSVSFPHALGRELGDRIRVQRQPPGGGDPIDRDQFIRGIQHEFEDEKWITKWVLQDATKFGSFLTLDNSTLGRLDENALAY